MTKFILPFILITLFNCSAVKIEDADKQAFDSSNDSVVRNYSVGENAHILSYLIDIKGIDDDAIKNGTLSYTMTSKNKIRLSFEFNGHIIDKEFKGRLANNEFRLKNRMKTKMLPPIFWALVGDSATIFRNNAGELIISSEHGGVILLTIIPIFGTTSGPIKGTFQPIN